MVEKRKSPIDTDLHLWYNTYRKQGKETRMFTVEPNPAIVAELDLEPHHVSNLIKLATHLYTHIPPPGFNMSAFAYTEVEPGDLDPTIYPADMTREVYETCGTVACAVGHGPYVGIEAREKEDWVNYSQRVFGLTEKHWSWCFSGAWETVDNTPKGAALRIKWVLEKEVTHTLYWDCIALYEHSLPYLEPEKEVADVL